MPGIWASEYALPLLLLSFNGAGGILYGGLGIFVLSSTTVAAVATPTTTIDDFNVVNLFNALDANDVEDDDDDSNDSDNGVGADGVDIIDWLSNGLPVLFTGAAAVTAIDSLPADKRKR